MLMLLQHAELASLALASVARQARQATWPLPPRPMLRLAARSIQRPLQTAAVAVLAAFVAAVVQLGAPAPSAAALVGASARRWARLRACRSTSSSCETTCQHPSPRKQRQEGPPRLRREDETCGWTEEQRQRPRRTEPAATERTAPRTLSSDRTQTVSGVSDGRSGAVPSTRSQSRFANQSRATPRNTTGDDDHDEHDETDAADTLRTALRSPISLTVPSLPVSAARSWGDCSSADARHLSMHGARSESQLSSATKSISNVN